MIVAINEQCPANTLAVLPDNANLWQ